MPFSISISSLRIPVLLIFIFLLDVWTTSVSGCAGFPKQMIGESGRKGWAMGGRGAYSATAKSRGKGNTLPHGGIAMTLKFKDGKEDSFYAGSGGVVMRSDSPGTTHGLPAGVNVSIRELYDRAVANGIEVTLYSADDVKAANSEYKNRRAKNHEEILYDEIHPQKGKRGIPVKRLNRAHKYRKNPW